MGARYPDRFAGVHSIVGHGSVHLENLTNVPVRFHNGLVDPVINVSSFRLTLYVPRLPRPWTIVECSERSHYTTALGECLELELLGGKRAISTLAAFATPFPLRSTSNRKLRPATEWRVRAPSS